MSAFQPAIYVRRSGCDQKPTLPFQVVCLDLSRIVREARNEPMDSRSEHDGQISHPSENHT